jgi:hypothetical protein
MSTVLDLPWFVVEADWYLVKPMLWACVDAIILAKKE